MPSNYQTFDLIKKGKDGTVTPLAGVTIKIHNAVNNTSLGTVTTDSNGVVAGGTLAVAPGTLILFRVENYQGMAGSIPQVTT